MFTAPVSRSSIHDFIVHVLTDFASESNQAYLLGYVLILNFLSLKLCFLQSISFLIVSHLLLHFIKLLGRD